jgi:hypothetical protein
MNRLFGKLSFDSNAGVMVGGSVLPWQILDFVVSISASLVVAYVRWHLSEKRFLRLKAFSPPTRARAWC